MKALGYAQLRRAALLTGMVLILPAAVHAAPSVSSVSGTVAHGATVAINGSGFGIKNPVAPAKYDPVDGVYTGLSDGAVIPVGSGRMWDSIGGSEGQPPVYSTSNHRGKLKASYSNKDNAGTNGDKSGVGNVGSYTVPGCSGGKMYVSWWFYPHGDLTASGSNKLFRLNDAPIGSDTVTFIRQSTGQYDIYDGSYRINIWGQTGWATNQWNRMEIMVDNSTTSPGHPHVKLWDNTSLEGDATAGQTDCGTACSPGSVRTNVCTIAALGANFSNADGKQPIVDFGEIYVDNTMARIEIGNASTYATSTVREIQIPKTQWVDNAIQFTVNQGSFADGAKAYLYVIDANGNPSNGLPITFGSSSTGGTAPSAVTSLKVQSVSPN